MILLGIDVDRDHNLRVTCHPNDRALMAAAFENMPAEIVESTKCRPGVWHMELVRRTAAVLILIASAVLGAGCAPRSGDVAGAGDAHSESLRAERAERLPLGLWRSAAIEAARAAAAGDAATSRRLNIALARDIYAAQERTESHSDAKQDARDEFAPTLKRAADALAELGAGAGSDGGK